MNILGVFMLLIPVLIGFYLCEWQVVVAFVVAVLVVPLSLIFSTHLFEAVFQNKPMDLKGAFEIGSMFSIFGIPIYFILILPVYYGLKSSSIPLMWGFPLGVTVILLILFGLFTTKPWGIKEFLVVAGCSILHAFFIIWLVGRLKAISF